MNINADTFCVCLEIPSTLAAKFGASARDPHITILYFQPRSEKEARLARNQVELLATLTEPVVAKLTGDLGYFEASSSSGGKRVAYVKVSSGMIAIIREKLLERFARVGIRASQDFDTFRPHATLAYLEPGEAFEGEVPEGSFAATEIQIWRKGSKKAIPLEPSSWPVDMSPRSGGRSIFQR